jgi:DNA polymerase III subunit delta
MKMSGAEATRYFAKPDPARTGLLIFGADPMRVALRRQEVIRALVGPDGEAEMRLTRLAAGDLRRDPANLIDAIKARSFFPGPRVVFLEDAADTHVAPLKAALEDWQPGDALVVVTAGGLTGKSALKKLFDDHRTVVCIGLYDDPPGREEVEGLLSAAGLRFGTRAGPWRFPPDRGKDRPLQMGRSDAFDRSRSGSAGPCDDRGRSG